MNGVLDWYRGGSAIAVATLVVAAAGLALFVERFYVIVLRSRVSGGRLFIERAIQLVRGGKLEDAIRHCARTKAVLPDVGLVILRSRTRDEGDLAHVARAATLSLLPPLARRLDYLRTLALLAGLLGVVGAAVGARDALHGDPALVAVGASPLVEGLARAFEALAGGLLVALPLVLGHAFLAHQARTIAEHAEEFAARLINALADRPDVRLGHR